MTQTIMLQQLKLHFGDEFPALYANTKSYVKGLIGKHSWWVDSRALVQSEGPLSRMVEDCLSHVVEKGDKEEGWKAYTAYLSRFYGTTGESSHVGRDLPFGQHLQWSTLAEKAINPAASPLSDTTGVEEHVSDELTLFDEEQAEFIQVYSRLGATEAANIFDMTPKQARTRRNTIKRTVARRLNNEL